MRTSLIVGAIATPIVIASLVLGVYFGTQQPAKSDPEGPKDGYRNVYTGRRRPNVPGNEVRGKAVEVGARPNIIMFLSDDTGYADFWSFGNPEQEFNRIDEMALDGMIFTHWTAGDRICSPSRAAFLTGQYPVRNGIYGPETVFPPDSTGGLPESAITVPEALADLGYATGMVGKWHLGINNVTNTDGVHLPRHHGFQTVKTILPFSQVSQCDMSQPVSEQYQDCYLYQDDVIIEQPINLTTLSQRLLDDAKTFITDNKDGPFFFYYSFPQTHEAMFCDPRFCGTSAMGAYGDDVAEMAWTLGEIEDLLKDLGIDDNTLQIYVSDNGPSDFNCFGEGSAGMFRGGKMTTWEGGLRVPAVVRWPGTIPSNTISHNLVNTMDLFPTFLYLAGDPNYMSDRGVQLDGQLIPDILQDDSIPVREIYYYYCSDRLTAVRYQQYKIHYATVGLENTKISNPSTDPICNGAGYKEPDCWDGQTTITWDDPLVFDLLMDPSETMVLDTSTDEMQQMLAYVQSMVDQQTASVVYVPPEFSKHGGDAIIPCCNPPACQCNYTGT